MQRFGYVESSGVINGRIISSVLKQLYFIRHSIRRLNTGRTIRENMEQMVFRKSISHVLCIFSYSGSVI